MGYASVNRPVKPDKSSRGFTLIEMLVALAVVSIALAAISSNYINYVDTTARLKDHTIARWVAENQLVKTKIETPWPALGSHQGTIHFAGADWNWEKVIRPSADRDFRQVEIQVGKKSAPGKSMAPLFSLVGYARNPNPARIGSS
jgi:general secretion pathway protein I